MNKTLKSIIWLVVLALVVWGVVALVQDSSSDVSSDKPVKVGAVFPLSGPLSIYGETERTATEYAVQEINNNGGINGRTIEVIYEDGKCNGQDALTAAKKLVEVNNVDIILGGSCSGETLGMAPYVEENNIILFTSIAGSPDISNYGNVFRNTIITRDEGIKLADFISSQGINNIAVLSANDPYPLGVRKGLKDRAEDIGSMNVIYDEVYEPSESDFKSYLTKVKSNNPEALFIFPLSGSTGGQIMKQIHEMNINIPIFGAETPGTTDFLEVAGSAADGIVYTDVPKIDQDNSNLVSILNYFENNNVTPVGNYFVASRYDSIQIIKDALNECGEDNECIISFVKNNTHTGIIGSYGFDENGDAVGIEISFKKITNGIPELITE